MLAKAGLGLMGTNWVILPILGERVFPVFAAGLDGNRKKESLVDPVEENIYHMSGTRQKKFDIRVLPRNLDEAVRIMEKSDLVRDALGGHIFEKLVANKKQEVEEYGRSVSGEFEKQVSDYEVERYLPFL